MRVPRWLKACAFWKRSTAEKPSVQLSTVFTPSAPAKKSYVPRPIPEADFKSNLRIPGTQIVVFGESGAGKSSLAIRVLEEIDRKYVVTRCTSDMNYTAVLTSGFHKIGALEQSGQQHTDERHVGVKGGYPGVVEGSLDQTVSQTKDYSPIVAPPLTAEHLAQLMGKRATSWIIEDFHKVDEPTRTSLSHALKVFSDNASTHPDTTIVVLGAADTSTQVWGSPANMQGRLAHIELPSLSEAELGQLLDTGAGLLNADFSSVRQEIIEHSAGLASVTHALAYLCCETLGILAPAPTQVVVTPDTLSTAKSSYSRTRTPDIKHAFEKAMTVGRHRTYDNRSIILKAMAGLGEKASTHAEILAVIKAEYPKYPPSNLTQYLRELQNEDRGAVLRKNATGQFRFAQPLMLTYARQLFNVNSSDGFWTGIEATQQEKDLAALTLSANT